MVAPGRWQDDGPGAAHRTSYGGALVTEKKPLVQVDRRLRRTASVEAVEAPKVVCGEMMTYGEPCARRPGHTYGHRSRIVMDEDARSRRAVR